MFRTGFPKLWPVIDPDARDLYLSSYTQTYIERDVRELMQVDKRREFERFLRLCALRTGCLVKLDDLARDSGVSAATVSGWVGRRARGLLQQLEGMGPLIAEETR
jgi:predicted AAA+ superfamily ATPase